MKEYLLNRLLNTLGSNYQKTRKIKKQEEKFNEKILFKYFDQFKTAYFLLS